jgi:hypothetical protein
VADSAENIDEALTQIIESATRKEEEEEKEEEE